MDENPSYRCQTDRSQTQRHRLEYPYFSRRARHGFENWPRYERRSDLFKYLHDRANPDRDLVITLLLTMTEEEYEKYDRVETVPRVVFEEV